MVSFLPLKLTGILLLANGEIMHACLFCPKDPKFARAQESPKVPYIENNQLNEQDDEDIETEDAILNAEYVEVDIDISFSAHANSTRLYEEKKKVGLKATKTAQGSAKALKAMEIEVQKQLKKQEKGIWCTEYLMSE